MHFVEDFGDLLPIECLLRPAGRSVRDPVPLCGVAQYLWGNCPAEELCPGPPRTLAVLLVTTRDDCAALTGASCSMYFGLQQDVICDWDAAAADSMSVPGVAQLVAETFGDSLFFGALIGLDDEGGSQGPSMLPLPESPWWEPQVICTSPTEETEATPAPCILALANELPEGRAYVGSVCDESFDEHLFEIGRRLGHLISPCPGP